MNDPHTFNLIYDAKTKTVTGQRDVRPMKIGDKVIFRSDAGPVHVKLKPADVLGATEFREKDNPLTVKKLSKFQYWCGVKVGENIVGFPANEKFGHADDTGDPR